MKSRFLCCFVLLIGNAFANIVSVKPTLPDFAKLLKDADNIVIWEGLPHPLFERVLFAQEKKKLHRKISTEYFYFTGIDVSAEDQAALNQLFLNERVCVPSVGVKFCGGFHADYAIEWKRGDEWLVRVLICFGCAETLVVTPAGEQATDMTALGKKTLWPLLRKYSLSRPPFSAVSQPAPKILPPKLDLKPLP